MNTLSESERQDVGDLLGVCRQFDADAVIIGATAYRLLIEDSDRHTLDIDLALALDVNDLGRFEDMLAGRGWQQSPRQEPRWITPRGNRFDLIPAGPLLRKAGRLVWPKSGLVMSLAGFDHVFNRAIVQDLGAGLQIKVVPPAVLALLKIASYLENPELRAKDLDDLKRLFRWYDHDSSRIFSDIVLQADLPDVDCAGAFLLGLDMRALAADADLSLVESFIEQMTDFLESVPRLTAIEDDLTTRDARTFQQQLASFAKGFKKVHK